MAGLPRCLLIGGASHHGGQIGCEDSDFVIVSMTTASGQSLTHRIALKQKPLNVAISRAATLAILVFVPSLLSIKCNTIRSG